MVPAAFKLPSIKQWLVAAEKEKRPVGGPAARGMGVMEVQTQSRLSTTNQMSCQLSLSQNLLLARLNPEQVGVCLERSVRSIDRGIHFLPVRKYPLPARKRGDLRPVFRFLFPMFRRWHLNRRDPWHSGIIQRFVQASNVFLHELVNHVRRFF